MDWGPTYCIDENVPDLLHVVPLLDAFRDLLQKLLMDSTNLRNVGKYVLEQGALYQRGAF